MITRPLHHRCEGDERDIAEFRRKISIDFSQGEEIVQVPNQVILNSFSCFTNDDESAREY